MTTSSYIGRIVTKMPVNELFTARQMLSCGRPAAVYKTLSRFVKRGRIIRVAHGVFMKAGSYRPSVLKVAKAKAKSFGKSIVSHGADLANKFALARTPIHNRKRTHTFWVNGPSSSFRYGKLTIRFISATPRKMHGGESKTAQLTRAVWYIGKENFDEWAHWAIGEARSKQDFRRADIEELHQSGSWMTGWMSRYFMGHQKWPDALKAFLTMPGWSAVLPLSSLDCLRFANDA